MSTPQEKFDEIKHMVPQKAHAMFETLVENCLPEPADADIDELTDLAVMLSMIHTSPRMQIAMLIDPVGTISSMVMPILTSAYNIGRARERDPLGGSLK